MKHYSFERPHPEYQDAAQPAVARVRMVQTQPTRLQQLHAVCEHMGVSHNKRRQVSIEGKNITYHNQNIGPILTNTLLYSKLLNLIHKLHVA